MNLFSSAVYDIQNPYGPRLTNPAYFHPMAQSWMTVGGTANDNAHADECAWHEVLEFLKRILGK